MTNDEKKWGKVIAIRLKKEDQWIADQLKLDSEKTDAKGRPLVKGGVSGMVALILFNYYSERRGLGEKTEAAEG